MIELRCSSCHRLIAKTEKPPIAPIIAKCPRTNCRVIAPVRVVVR